MTPRCTAHYTARRGVLRGRRLSQRPLVRRGLLAGRDSAGVGNSVAPTRRYQRLDYVRIGRGACPTLMSGS